MKKFTDKSVKMMLRHNAREIMKPSNKDIDPARTPLNFKLSPERKIIKNGKFQQQSDFEHYKQRLSKMHVFNRSDVKTVAGWIVTAPKDLKADKHKVFFQEVYNFLEARYGKENVIQAMVHNDETTPHLHFLFIPVAPNPKLTGGKSEKVCANEVLTRQELRAFHPALQAHLNHAGIQARIINGATSAGNRTVAEMKKDRERTQQHERGIFLER